MLASRAFCLVSLLVLLTSLAYADTKIILAEATYIMGDGETPSFAEAMALQKAKQTALEEAGTYVQSYTKILNQQLTADEIQTVAGGVMRVEVQDKTRTVVSEGFRVHVKIKATVTTDKVEELAKRIQGTQAAEEYKQLQHDYAKLTAELDTLKKSLATAPPGQARESVIDQIRQEQKIFLATQQRETALFQRVVSGSALVRQAEDLGKEVAQLLQTLMEQGFTVEIGEAKVVVRPGTKHGFAQLIVPMAVRSTALFRPTLSALAERLEGAVVFDAGIEYTTFDDAVEYTSKTRSSLDSGSLLMMLKPNLALSVLREHVFKKLDGYRLIMDFVFSDGTIERFCEPGKHRIVAGKALSRYALSSDKSWRAELLYSFPVDLGNVVQLFDGFQMVTFVRFGLYDSGETGINYLGGADWKYWRMFRANSVAFFLDSADKSSDATVMLSKERVKKLQKISASFEADAVSRIEPCVRLDRVMKSSTEMDKGSEVRN